jgi:hypothetical protein
MRMIEITRTDDASVADQMSEMNEWLREKGIQPFQLEPIQIEEAQVRYRAIFAISDDAERFCRRFEEASARALT